MATAKYFAITLLTTCLLVASPQGSTPQTPQQPAQQPSAARSQMTPAKPAQPAQEEDISHYVLGSDDTLKI